MITKTLKEIAALIGGTVDGENVTITGFNGIKEAKSGDLTFLAERKYLPLASQTKASAVIVSEDIGKISGLSVIFVKDPAGSFSKVVETFLKADHYVERGIHSTASIGDEVHLGQNVSVGPCAIIQKGARIGDDTIIHGGCFIGFRTTIGANCEIYSLVTIRERCQIGDRVMIHSGAVIGADGFGFQFSGGKHAKIPQVGIVRIEDDVEIGANTTIDRARLHETVIGEGTKIDNLVQIGHNVIIGKNCLILSHAGISGSVVIEDDVIIAGQVGIAGHLTIGKGAVIAAQSGVIRDVEPGVKMFGSPAKPHIQTKRMDISLQNLPKAMQMMRDLLKRVGDLESKLKP